MFGVFHARLGTPVRVNLLSGCVASVFMVAATNLVRGTAIFGVVLAICVSTYLLAYLAVIPAAGRLRSTHPDVPRPFRVPGPPWVYRALVGLCLVWVALLTGFTLGTLGLLAVLAFVGYAAGRTLRGRAATGDRTGAERDVSAM